MDVDKIEGYYQNALKYAQIGEYEIALDMVGKIHKLSPDNDAVYLIAAAIKMQAEDYDGCIIESEHCVRIKPDNASGWNHLGVALCCSGQISTGLSKLKIAIELGMDEAGSNYLFWSKK